MNSPSIQDDDDEEEEGSLISALQDSDFDMSTSSQIVDTWISNFCNLVGHEYFAEVAEDFIEDDFNLTGLQSQVPMYKEALEMILDVEPEEDDDETEEIEEDDEDDMLVGGPGVGGGGAFPRAADRRHLRLNSDASMIETSAELLYGLIHQRYITSRPGIHQMLEKYEMCHFGMCPRVLCRGAKVIPVGRTDTPGQDTVKLFCPSCLDIYTPPNSRFQSIDGAFFGTTFGCLFFMTFPDVDVGGHRSIPSLPVLPVSAAAPASSNTSHAMISSTSGASVVPQSSSSTRAPLLSSSAPSAPSLPPQPLVVNGAPAASFASGLGSTDTGHIYIPRIYGFRVSERAKSGPRMQWLRSKPADLLELDEEASFTREQAAAADVDEAVHDDDDDAGAGMPLDVAGEDCRMVGVVESVADDAERRKGVSGTGRKTRSSGVPLDDHGNGG